MRFKASEGTTLSQLAALLARTDHKRALSLLDELVYSAFHRASSTVVERVFWLERVSTSCSCVHSVLDTRSSTAADQASASLTDQLSALAHAEVDKPIL